MIVVAALRDHTHDFGRLILFYPRGDQDSLVTRAVSYQEYHRSPPPTRDMCQPQRVPLFDAVASCFPVCAFVWYRLIVATDATHESESVPRVNIVRFPRLPAV